LGQLILKRAAASRLSGEWNDDDYDVLCEGAVVGRIMKSAAAPVGQPWLWTLAYGHHEDHTPTHGYGPTREAAMGSHQRRARRCRLQLHPAPALVRGAFTRPPVDPLAPPLGRPVSPNPCRKTFFTAD
jgi:hypothetical protein